MAKDTRIIRAGCKLLTIKEIIIDDKSIPAGSIFYAYKYDPKYGEVKASDIPMPRMIPMAGFGQNITLCMEVTTDAPPKPLPTFWITFSKIFLPLDCLQLVEE